MDAFGRTYLRKALDDLCIRPVLSWFLEFCSSVVLCRGEFCWVAGCEFAVMDLLITLGMSMENLFCKTCYGIWLCSYENLVNKSAVAMTVALLILDYWFESYIFWSGLCSSSSSPARYLFMSCMWLRFYVYRLIESSTFFCCVKVCPNVCSSRFSSLVCKILEADCSIGTLSSIFYVIVLSILSASKTVLSFVFEPFPG